MSSAVQPLTIVSSSRFDLANRHISPWYQHTGSGGVVEGCEMDKSTNKMVFPKDFLPGNRYVICGRGKKSYGHMGNKHFVTKIVSKYVEEYSYAKTKLTKSGIVAAIVNEVESEGGFIRWDTRLQRYVLAEDNIGREKTSQSLRDGLKNKYKSSKEIKRENRRQKRLASGSSDEEEDGDEEESSMEEESTTGVAKRTSGTTTSTSATALFNPATMNTQITLDLKTLMQKPLTSLGGKSPTTVMDLINHLRLAEVVALPIQMADTSNSNTSNKANASTTSTLTTTTTTDQQQKPTATFVPPRTVNVATAESQRDDDMSQITQDMIFQAPPPSVPVPPTAAPLAAPRELAHYAAPSTTTAPVPVAPVAPVAADSNNVDETAVVDPLDMLLADELLGELPDSFDAMEEFLQQQQQQ